MNTPLFIAALVAVFGWWFFTGAILYIVRRYENRSEAARQGLCMGGLVAFALAWWGFAYSLSGQSAGQIYIGFFSVLVIWGWVELCFLTGVISGPNLFECPQNIPPWERFIRAWGTIAYHEMLLLLVLALVVYQSYGAVNSFGTWIFVILYFARISAKLNLFLGVPRINIEFVPKALSHLPSHFRIANTSWLFPVSITLLSFATACWFERLYAAHDLQGQIGFALLGAMSALALLEHWFMVLPVPDAKLWRWMLPSPKSKKPKYHREDYNEL